MARTAIHPGEHLAYANRICTSLPSSLRIAWKRGVGAQALGLAQRGFDPSEHRQHDRNGLSGGLASEPGGERHAGFALMENEHRPCALTNDEVTLPMAALGSAVDSLGPLVDGRHDP